MTSESRPTSLTGPRARRRRRGRRRGAGTSTRRTSHAWTRRRRRGVRPAAPTRPTPVARGPEADPESVARTILLDQLTGQARTRTRAAPTSWPAQNVPDERGRAAARPVRGGRAGRRRGLRAGLGGEPPAAAGGWPAGRWPRSCAARASTTRSPARRWTRSTPTTRRPPRAALVAQEAALAARRRPAPPPPDGWSACWPARATPPAWRSRWCARSWADSTRTTDRLAGVRSRHARVRPGLRISGGPMSTRVVVVHRGRELDGVVHEGESWAAAARRTCASISGEPMPVDLASEAKVFVVDPDVTVTVRAMTRGDLPDVLRWRQAPHVHRWWHAAGDPTAEEVADRYGPRIDGCTPTRMWVAEVNGRSVGFVQDYRLGRLPGLRPALPRPGRRSASTTRSASPAGSAAGSGPGCCGRGCCGPTAGSPRSRRTSRPPTTATTPRCGCSTRPASSGGCGSTSRSPTASVTTVVGCTPRRTPRPGLSGHCSALGCPA